MSLPMDDYVVALLLTMMSTVDSHIDRIATTSNIMIIDLTRIQHNKCWQLLGRARTKAEQPFDSIAAEIAVGKECTR